MNFISFKIALASLLSSFLFLALPARAENVRVSLLTCEPGSEIYALFGHTAIRYEDSTRNIDWVYNYGMFSFNSPNFVYRFVKGETDYQLGVVPYSYFEAEYALRGSSVFQQTLQLTIDEKRRIKQLLDTNYLPQNRVYRYNFLTDNCTTRARDIIEEAIDGEVVYGAAGKQLSYRGILHQFTSGHDWSELGIDLCLGEGADTIITERQQQFAPFYFYNALKEAVVVRGDTLSPFMISEEKVVDVVPDEAELKIFLSPLWSAYLFLLLTVTMVVMQFLAHRRFLAWDCLVAFLQGGAGCVILFLVLFSVHPTVNQNWLVIWLNPLVLIALPFNLYAYYKGRKMWFYGFNALCLTLFIVVSPFIVQKFHASVLPLALSLLLHSVGNLCLPVRKIK